MHCYCILRGAECEDLCNVTVFYMGLNVRSTVSTITSITYDVLSIQSDVITQQQQQYVCLRILQCTHHQKHMNSLFCGTSSSLTFICTQLIIVTGHIFILLHR